MGVDYVDITDINEEGLLYDDSDRIRIAQKFKEEKVDGLFPAPYKLRNRIRVRQAGQGTECAGASLGAAGREAG